MDDQWRIATYDSEWRVVFLKIGTQLRDSLGQLATRIDHVGSTSIVGMDAKPIVDIQISVVNFDDEEPFRGKIEKLGFVLRKENPDKTKKYFRENPGNRRIHIHVRRSGSFSEEMTLLFRDYLRIHPEDCKKYAKEKHRLMTLYKNDRPKYVDGKGPVVWEILQRAHLWSQATGWKPSKSDV